MKEAEGCLSFQFVSPGSAYSKQLWDWDSYWTLYALIRIAKREKDKGLLEKLRPFALGTIENFLQYQGIDGSLPIMISVQSADPFESTKSPDKNMAKPFIAQTLLMLLKENIASKDQLGYQLPSIRRYHQCYEKRYLDQRTGLVFWAQDLGIGIDDDPCAWGRPEKSCASVFLNTFLLKDYQAMEELCTTAKMFVEAADYRDKIECISKALMKYCWDEREKAFFSLDIQCHPNLMKNPQLGLLNSRLDTFWNGLKLKVLSWCSVLPFWAGLGSDEQFSAWVRENLVPERLLSPFGVRSLSKDEMMYSPEVSRGNPSNWLGPIWLIANYIVWETLKMRGHSKNAASLAENILNMLAADLKQNGAFHEYYSPETGKGVHNKNFMSWNALAAIMEQVVK